VHVLVNTLGQSIPNHPNLGAREITICLKFSRYLENNNKNIFPGDFCLYLIVFLAGMKVLGLATLQKRGNSKLIHFNHSNHVFYSALHFK